MKVRFQKMLIFPADVNDFIKQWGELGITLGQILAYECDFGVTLASLLTCEGDFGAKLRSPWADFSHMRVTLGQLRDHFGVTFGI